MTKLDSVYWHLGGDSFPKGMPEENAAIHIGCFVAWTIKRGLWDGSMFDTAGPAMEAVAQGWLSGRSFLLQECDGKLLSQMLNPEGAAFGRTATHRQRARMFAARTLRTFGTPTPRSALR
jgi:hypothetical protein